MTPEAFRFLQHMAASGSEALSRSSSMSLPDGGAYTAQQHQGLRPSESDVQLSLDLRAGLADSAEQPSAPGAHMLIRP